MVLPFLLRRLLFFSEHHMCLETSQTVPLYPPQVAYSHSLLSGHLSPHIPFSLHEDFFLFLLVVFSPMICPPSFYRDQEVVPLFFYVSGYSSHQLAHGSYLPLPPSFSLSRVPFSPIGGDSLPFYLRSPLPFCVVVSWCWSVCLLPKLHVLCQCIFTLILPLFFSAKLLSPVEAIACMFHFFLTGDLTSFLEASPSSFSLFFPFRLLFPFVCLCSFFFGSPPSWWSRTL